MEWKEILDIIVTILGCVVFIVMIIHFILDIRNSDAYWKRMKAEVDLFSASLKKEHALLKKVQEYSEWLDTYHALMRTNVKLEDSEFNRGTLMAAGDIEDEFLRCLGEYVDGDLSKE